MSAIDKIVFFWYFIMLINVPFKEAMDRLNALFEERIRAQARAETRLHERTHHVHQRRIRAHASHPHAHPHDPHRDPDEDSG